MIQPRSMIAALSVAVALTMTMSGCSGPPRGGIAVDEKQSRQAAEQVLHQVFDVDGSEWPEDERNAEPAHAECTADDDPHGGRQDHWNAMGSAPSDPQAYIEAVANMLREHDRTVAVQSADVGRYGTLYQAVADDDGKPMVAVTANPRTTTITVESMCASVVEQG
jgi:surface antigen